jgi:hypothetical protein
MKSVLRRTSAKPYAMEWFRRSVREFPLRPRNILHEMMGGLSYLGYAIASRRARPSRERNAS